MDSRVLRDAPGDLLEPQDEAYAVVDQDGVLLAWSVAAQVILGYRTHEIRGRNATDLLNDRADRPRILRHCRDDEHTANLGRVILRHRDGRPVPVVLGVHRLAFAAGEQHWLVRVVDAEVAGQQELADSLLRGLFTESPFLIDVFDTRLRFLAKNYAMSRSTTVAGEDFVGRTMREFAPAGLLDMDAFEARQRQVLATGEALVATEVRGRTPDDPDRDHVWAETIVPLRNRSAEVLALAHAVIDVTQEARARERLALVNAASREIGSTLDVLHTAQELTDVAVPQFADEAYVNLLDPVFGGEEPAAGPVAESVPLRRAATSTIPQGPLEAAVATGDVDPFTSGVESLVSRAMSGGEPLLLTGEELLAEIATADPGRAAQVRAYGVHSWLLVPMSARGAVLGAVVFVRFHRSYPFEADDVLLAQEIVARAAVCIDNARRYTRERTTVLALQHNLLADRMPVLGAVQATARYLPSSGHSELGGAWFDVIPLSGARVALVVGEAAGQGLHAAVTMGRLRMAVRTLADLDLSPAELLTHLNDQVNRFEDEHRQEGHGEGGSVGAAGTTCVYAVFDPVALRCVSARAGNPPPVLASTDGKVEVLDLPGGPPLGRGGAPFESHELTLSDGDVLVLYTDGLVAPQEQGRDAGVEALRGILSDPGLVSSPRLDDICDAVLQPLLPARPRHDVTLLVARVHGLAADRHATWELAAEPEVVGRARALAAAKLAEWGLEELEFSTELMVSELVTNAIRYGQAPIRLRLIRDRSLICEVSDGSSTSPHIRRALETDEGGRGLFMVSQLAQLWGTRYHDRGKTIWAEQPLPEGSPAAQ